VDVSGRVAVVTGAASGIGRALSQALADAGAAAVVVADLDGAGAEQAAAEIAAAGHRALPAAADVADPAQAQNLIDRVLADFGRIDLLCSNAGIFAGGGVDLADETWSRMWQVNVQSHVCLARAVLPSMLSRGEGYLMLTASAAGLLTQLGSAPYAVTKHALVALAEWLSISYADRGIRVSCLCPQAVRTNLSATSRRQLPADGPPPAAGPSRQAAVDGTLTAAEVAASVLDAIASERFLILPHPEVASYERHRAEDRDRWLRGMRRLKSRLAASS
jgi:NAD(P)-dependent dehydrogenase (short-subunit alcohol dehydrogenase family)